MQGRGGREAAKAGAAASGKPAAPAPADGDGGTLRARVVTLRFDPLLEAFDDSPLQELLKTREVFSIRDHFFVRNEVPQYLVLWRPLIQRGTSKRWKLAKRCWMYPSQQLFQILILGLQLLQSPGF